MIVILHNIRSLYNVGSIFRTADAAGIKKIYLCGITPTPVDRFGKIQPQLAKVSLGAEKFVAWEYCKSTTRLIDKLKASGFSAQGGPRPKADESRTQASGWKIFAIEQSKKSIPYYNLKTNAMSPGDIALVLGGEVKGLPKSILDRADKILEIPMHGKKESLNVAVAFGIVAFHLLSK